MDHDIKVFNVFVAAIQSQLRLQQSHLTVILHNIMDNDATLAFVIQYLRQRCDSGLYNKCRRFMFCIFTCSHDCGFYGCRTPPGIKCFEKANNARNMRAWYRSSWSNIIWNPTIIWCKTGWTYGSYVSIKNVHTWCSDVRLKMKTNIW